MNRNLEMPALNGEVVTEFHSRVCRERGHATHTVNGAVQPKCPRCGEHREVAEFPKYTVHKKAFVREGSIAFEIWKHDTATGRRVDSLGTCPTLEAAEAHIARLQGRVQSTGGQELR